MSMASNGGLFKEEPMMNGKPLMFDFFCGEF